MRRASLLLVLALAGCPRHKEAPPAVSPAPAVPEAVAPGPKVVEELEAPIKGSQGGRVALAGGARFEAAPGAFGGDTKIRLARAEGGLYSLSSSERPRVRGALTLTLPYDPAALAPGESEDGLMAAAVVDGTLMAPARFRLDKANRAVVVLDPDISCPGPSFRQGATSPRRGLRGINIWYMIIHMLKYGTGVKQVVELPGHCFCIVCNETVPRELAEDISTTLQKIYDLYTREYAAVDGTPALARFTPRHRMFVYVRNNPGVNGEYEARSIDGYMVIDAKSAQGKRDELVGTLYHEMFHAVQDTYCGMILGAIASMWWYEATAEWAGLKGRGLKFPEMVREEFATYPYVLSVPPQESRSYMEGMLSYGDALLIEHVNARKPGHLKDTLQSWATRSGALFDRLVEDGRLGQTYGDYARDVLLAVLPDRAPWIDASLHVAASELRQFKHGSTEIGDPATPNVERFPDFGERRFAVDVAPFTTRFFMVRAEPRKEGASLEVGLLRDGKPWTDAWMVTVAKGSPRALRPAAVRDLGGSVSDVWLAVYNADPEANHRFDVSLTVRPATARKWKMYGIEQEGHMLSIVLDADPPPAKIGPARWTRLKLTVNGRTYTSYGRIAENGAAFEWPDPALKPGKNSYTASVNAFGETVTLDGVVESRTSRDYALEQIAHLKKDIADRKKGAEAWIELGDNYAYLCEQSEAKAAYEKARALEPRRDDEVRVKLAILRIYEADLDGFVAALGGEDHPYAKSRRADLARWSVWWKDDLAGYRRYNEMNKAERAREGVKVGDVGIFPGPDDEILK
ncbi:MAG: tetratricopeptide repeat protein [Planctomycetes bacterium]|nr:tetratricopeptide repeat protein [Planctomycetota bacterium]